MDMNAQRIAHVSKREDLLGDEQCLIAIQSWPGEFD